MPRHPPIALKTLDRSHCQCPSGLLRTVIDTKRPASRDRSGGAVRLTHHMQGIERHPATNRIAAESEQIFSSRCHVEQAADRKPDRHKSWLLRMTSRHQRCWWSRTGSNRRPPACKAGALPAELRPLDRVKMTNSCKGRRGHPFPSICACCHLNLMGLGGLEPPTSRLSSAHSNQLSYKPLNHTQLERRKPADRRARVGHSRRKRNEGGRYPLLYARR